MPDASMPEARHAVTLLFLDIPTALDVRDRQGAEAAARFLAEVTAVLDRIRREHGGAEVRTVGSALLSRFPDPLSALRAAGRMHATADASRMVATQPRLRIGVHCGDVTVHGHSVYGEAVSMVARLASLCALGQTLTSEAVREGLPAEEQEHLRPLPAPQGWAASLGELYEVLRESGLDGTVAAVELPARTQHVPVPDPGAASTGGRRVQLTRWHRKQSTPSAAGLPGHGARLCLIRGRDVHLVDTECPVLALGREAGNDVVVDSPTASRRHAQVEWRPDGFYLVDHSWNGTYLYDEAGRETHVHNAECRLHDSGFICPGCPGSHDEADVLRFVEAR